GTRHSCLPGTILSPRQVVGKNKCSPRTAPRAATGSARRPTSVFFELGDAIDRLIGLIQTGIVADPELHQECVFAAVFVIAAQDLSRAEVEHLEEELSREIRFADGQCDLGAPVAR